MLLAVLDLAGHCGGAAFLQQRPRIAAQQQPRHEIFEHGSAPGQERHAAAGARQRPGQVEPVTLRHVAASDGQEAGEAGLGGEQVVMRIIEPVEPQVEADGKELARLVIEHAKIHVRCQRRGPIGQSLATRQQLGGGRSLKRLRDGGKRIAIIRDRAVTVVAGVVFRLPKRSQVGEQEVDVRLQIGEAAGANQTLAEFLPAFGKRGLFLARRGCRAPWFLSHQIEPGGQGGQLVALLADLVGEALRPQLQVFRGLVQGAGQALNIPAQFFGALLRLLEPDFMTAEIVRNALQALFERLQRCLQPTEKIKRLRSGRRLQGQELLLDQAKGVAQAAAQGRFGDQLFNLLAQSLLERQQAPQQVAAIHRGEVTRLERAQGLRVVPVIEMAVKALQGIQRIERLFQALDQGG